MGDLLGKCSPGVIAVTGHEDSCIELVLSLKLAEKRNFVKRFSIRSTRKV
jgi:hypothetical protein